MLLPIVIKTPGRLWGTNSQEALLFESRTMPENGTVTPKIDIENIPWAVRTRAREDINDEKHRAATDEEIIQWYVDFISVHQ